MRFIGSNTGMGHNFVTRDKTRTCPSPNTHLTSLCAFASPSCANANRAFGFAFACERGIFHTVPTRSRSPDPEYSPPSFTFAVTLGQRHDKDTTSTCSLSPPLPLPSPSSSATTPGQQCPRSYDHATTTIMPPTMPPTTTRNDTMHSIARAVPSLVSWSCLKGLTSRRPVESAQTQTVLSSDPVAIFVASGETSTARTQLR
jgi:hypothetical protein